MRFANVSEGLKTPKPTRIPQSCSEGKTGRAAFYWVLPSPGAIFLSILGFAARSWVLYLPPTQNNVFAYGICDICLDVSLPEWEVSGTGWEEEQQARAFCFGVKELPSSKWFHFCVSEEKDKQGQSGEGRGSGE